MWRDPTTFDPALLTPTTLFWARDCQRLRLFNLLRLTPILLLQQYTGEPSAEPKVLCLGNLQG